MCHNTSLLTSDQVITPQTPLRHWFTRYSQSMMLTEVGSLKGAKWLSFWTKSCWIKEDRKLIGPNLSISFKATMSTETELFLNKSVTDSLPISWTRFHNRFLKSHNITSKMQCINSKMQTQTSKTLTLFISRYHLNRLSNGLSNSNRLLYHNLQKLFQTYPLIRTSDSFTAINRPSRELHSSLCLT